MDRTIFSPIIIIVQKYVDKIVDFLYKFLYKIDKISLTFFLSWHKMI